MITRARRPTSSALKQVLTLTNACRGEASQGRMFNDCCRFIKCAKQKIKAIKYSNLAALKTSRTKPRVKPQCKFWYTWIIKGKLNWQPCNIYIIYITYSLFVKVLTIWFFKILIHLWCLVLTHLHSLVSNSLFQTWGLMIKRSTTVMWWSLTCYILPESACQSLLWPVAGGSWCINESQKHLQESAASAH